MSIPVTDALLASWPPDAQAVVRLLMQQNAELKAQVAELKARLNKNPANSSLPPSRTHPHAKPSRQSLRMAKRRGASRATTSTNAP